jgi:outer membrane receptor protein involved in Fe transport
MEEQKKQVNSLLGSAQFAYNDYLFLELTGRNDWSSTLPEGGNSYFYPSVSTSLVFTDVVPSLSLGGVLGYGKIRGGWTRVGNDADPYQLASVYTANTPFGSVARYAVPNRIANAELKPEETTAWEIGTELEFLDNRLGLDLTYYDKSTANQILAVQISPATGFTEKVLNAGEITNKGIEATLSLVPVRLANGFEWSVTGNYAKNESKVAELFGDLQTVVLGTYWGLTVEARKGEPYGALFGNPYLRNAQGQLILLGGLPQYDPAKKVLGNYNPDWTGSLLNQFRFKNFDLSVLLDTKQGGELFSVTYMFGRYAGVLEETVEGREGGILVPGVDTSGAPNTTRVSAEDYNHNFYPGHEGSIFDASFIKLREVKLGWQVPGSLAGRLGFGSAYVSFTGRNLWLSTDVPHIDPETAFDASNVQGLEFGQFPSQRSFGFHLSVTR